jgi:hypothetical protein
MNHQPHNLLAMDARHECQPRSCALARIAYEDLPAQAS